MKKIISIALIVSMFGILAQANGETGNIITYDKAKEVMLSNNRTLKSLAIEERKMFLNYNSIVQGTKNLKTDGVTFKFGGREFFFEYDDNTKLSLTLAKEYTPAELKYYWNKMIINKTITEKSLYLNMRDLYLGLMKSDKDYKLAQKKYQLAESKHRINKLKFEQGLITRQDLDESEYELLKAEKSVEEAKRNRENTVRSMNSILGADISTEYEEVIFDELKRNITLKPLEYYIEKALAERYEIKSIEEELRLKELKKGIIEKSKLFKKNYNIMEQYEDLELEIETLKVKMEKARFDIENDIKKAYIEIKNDLNTIESTTETIKMQKRNLDKMKQQYERGFISKIVLDEMEIGIEELENMKEYVIYSYNTKIMKLEEAAGLGPAYGKE
ncbi:TolC family protein [Acetivibrio clariflavus]|uniref:TolC family protein n=1 Tax=Acetivibrio clariflavus TaxID=288965 RepID=UPI00047FE10D|nr:TolC family protein [Acetivibrio clariflavus]